MRVDNENLLKQNSEELKKQMREDKEELNNKFESNNETLQQQLKEDIRQSNEELKGLLKDCLLYTSRCV